MALSNTAVPKYYGMFRDAVIRGEIPVCKEISMEMNRIDDLIANPGVYYDDQAVEGWIAYCESELTLTDGSDLKLLDSFKLWGEQIFGWYYFVERSVYRPNPDGSQIHVWFNTSGLLPECRYFNNAPNHYSSNNEAGRRGYVSASNCYYTITRPSVSISDRRFFAEYNRIESKSDKAGVYEKGR